MRWAGGPRTLEDHCISKQTREDVSLSAAEVKETEYPKEFGILIELFDVIQLKVFC